MNAIIMAAGMGQRAVPFTYDTPKGLLTVFGKPLIERQIEQLLEKEITEIIIITGYMKERFEYLVNRYGVQLVYNPEYADKNNLASLWHVRDRLKDTYICCCDNYMKENIFSKNETVSWFSCPYYEKQSDSEWYVSKSNEDGVILEIKPGCDNAYAIQGPVFFNAEYSGRFVRYLDEYYKNPESADWYFEQIVRDELKNLPPLYIKDTTGILYEFESYEDLREFDSSYKEASCNKYLNIISDALSVPAGEIHDLYLIKDGLSNDSFHFAVGDEHYVFRIPGAGTDKLVDRRNEKAVYDVISKYGLTDEIVYFDAQTGIKISRFINYIRVADPYDDTDLEICMQQIKKIHQIPVPEQNTINDVMEYYRIYESLVLEMNALSPEDLQKAKEKADKLLEIQNNIQPPVSRVISHGDYNHTNVFILPDGSCRIIDWEYSGLADPIFDVSMFCLFQEFAKDRIDLALRFYLGREPDKNERARLYIFVAYSAYVWYLWCECKRVSGEDFSETSAHMLGTLNEYYDVVMG